MLDRLLPLFAASALSAASVSTFAGNGQKGYSGDGGPASSATINDPFGVVRGPDGAIWFCEYGGQRIRRVDQDGKITLIAGNGQKGYSGDGGPATAATFNLPHELRFGPKRGNLFVVDMQNHAVRKIDVKTGVITTVAGTGQPGYSGDGGPADKAQLKQPHSIQFSPDGKHLYICDIGNHVIRRVDMKTKRIETFAGTGKAGDTPDGSPLRGTPLRGPRSLDFDRKGDLWLCTREGNQVFRFDMKAGVIRHVVGSGKKGFSTESQPAKQAALNGPKGVAVDAKGDAWIVDTESHSIRVYRTATDTLELAVGTGKKHDGPDGDPLKCGLARPHGVWVDDDGKVFIGDSENHRVRVLRP
ncbi:MAG: SMP-30/gluconolactonase/LRE family protein [Opitutia bacterium]|jgi:streptogramin lyase